MHNWQDIYIHPFICRSIYQVMHNCLSIYHLSILFCLNINLPDHRRSNLFHQYSKLCMAFLYTYTWKWFTHKSIRILDFESIFPKIISGISPFLYWREYRYQNYLIFSPAFNNNSLFSALILDTVISRILHCWRQIKPPPSSLIIMFLILVRLCQVEVRAAGVE